MAKRRLGLISLFLCLCLMPCHAHAENRTECTLTLSYACDGIVFSKLPIKLYKIAEESPDSEYVLTKPFSSSGLSFRDTLSDTEWNITRQTLESHILAGGIEADRTGTTDKTGQIFFDTLEPGIYLATVGIIPSDKTSYRFSSTLITLPVRDAVGHQKTRAKISSKAEIIPPIKPDEEIEFRVVKLWKGDRLEHRPQSVSVDLFRDGVLDTTVILSEENHWSYSWSSKKDNSTWMVAERNVPAGYTMTVELRDNTFVLTNATIPEPPDKPNDPTTPGDIPSNPPPAGNTPNQTPHTGDTANILLYIVLMCTSGIALIVLGTHRKRNRYDK